MGAKAKKGSALAPSNGLRSDDKLIVVATQNNVVNTYTVNTSVFFSNTAVPFITVGNNAVSTANLVLRSVSAPVSSSSNGAAGQVVWDSGFVYICVATNTWKRAALTSF